MRCGDQLDVITFCWLAVVGHEVVVLPELHSFGLVGVSGWGFSLEWWGWGGCCGALASIFHWLVERGVGGVVAGVVGAIMPVGCDGLPRVVSRWSGLSRGQGYSFRVVVGRRRRSGAYGAGRA